MLPAESPNNLKPRLSNSGWRASLAVKIDRHDGRSFLKHWSHKGPLKLQRAFYPEGQSVCHLTILHPPGGIVAGDSLSLDFQLSPNAHSLITTPAAGKFYHGDDNQRSQIQNIQATLDTNAILEWFPQENIIFNGANAELSNQFVLAPDALLTGWDINCLGRPAANEQFENGFFKQRLQLWRKQSSAKGHEETIKPIYIENSFYQGGHNTLNSKCGLQGYPVFGTFFATHQTEQQKLIRNALKQEACITSASQLPDIFVCRYLGHSTEQAKMLFTRAWDIIRREQLGRPACRPRIWNT